MATFFKIIWSVDQGLDDCLLVVDLLLGDDSQLTLVMVVLSADLLRHLWHLSDVRHELVVVHLVRFGRPHCSAVVVHNFSSRDGVLNLVAGVS